jgi:hypothetical protein
MSSEADDCWITFCTKPTEDRHYFIQVCPFLEIRVIIDIYIAVAVLPCSKQSLLSPTEAACHLLPVVQLELNRGFTTIQFLNFIKEGFWE